MIRPANVYCILVVCTGNICRSPMAQVVLTERFDELWLSSNLWVDSAGISNEEAGSEMDPRAAKELLGRGYPAPHHNARQVKASDAEHFDLFLAMTAEHARALKLIGIPEEKIRLYRSYEEGAPESIVDGDRSLDVADPWYGNEADFAACLDQIEAVAPRIVAEVTPAIKQRAEAAGA